MPDGQGDECEARGDIEAHAVAERAGEGGGPVGKAAVTSSAPYLYEASTRTDLLDWGVQSDAIEGVSCSTGRLVHKGPDNRPETGIWVCTQGRWRLSIPRDEL